MARAYKCDICGNYCEDVYTIHGVSTPEHSFYDHLKGDSADCCKDCYDEIMVKIKKMIKLKAGE